MNSLLARKFRFRRNIIIAENGSKVLDDFTIRVYNLLSLSRISSIQTAILVCIRKRENIDLLKKEILPRIITFSFQIQKKLSIARVSRNEFVKEKQKSMDKCSRACLNFLRRVTSSPLFLPTDTNHRREELLAPCTSSSYFCVKPESIGGKPSPPRIIQCSFPLASWIHRIPARCLHTPGSILILTSRIPSVFLPFSSARPRIETRRERGRARRTPGRIAVHPSLRLELIPFCHFLSTLLPLDRRNVFQRTTSTFCDPEKRSYSMKVG